MRTVRRYISKQVFTAVLFITAGFLALFAFFDVLNDLSFSSRTATPYGLINSLAYIVLLLPGHTYELLPIAVLIGTVFVMASLAQNSEFTILRTSGLGPWRALRNLLWLGALFTVLTFLIGDYIAPGTEKLAQYYKARFEGNVTKGYTGAWIKESINGSERIVNVQELTPDGQMRAIQAGNQLSALQVQEARQLRELMATQVQSQLASQMKAEKESQMAEEAWRDTIKTDRIGRAKAKPDPF